MVLNDIKVEVILERVGKEAVSDGSISESRAKDRNVVLIAPVVDAFLVVDFLSKSMDELARSPSDIILFLLFGHLGKKRKQKAFKFDIVVVGNQQVSDPAMSVKSVLDVVHVELSQMEGAQALHDIFLNASSGRNDAVDHLVLRQVADDVSHSTGGHV